MPLYNGYFYPVVQRPFVVSEVSTTTTITSGSIKQFSSGESINSGNVVFIKNEQVYKANANNFSSSLLIGISLESKSIGEQINVLVGHGMTADKYAGLSSGKRYFLGENGQITDNPNYNNIVQIGIANSSNELMFVPLFFIKK